MLPTATSADEGRRQILSCLTDDIELTVFGGYHLIGKEAYDSEIENLAVSGCPELRIVRLVEQGDVVMGELDGKVHRTDGSLMRIAMAETWVMRDNLICEGPTSWSSPRTSTADTIQLVERNQTDRGRCPSESRKQRDANPHTRLRELGGGRMTRMTCHMSISLDGFVAGADQSRDDPVGVGGLRHHEWHQRASEPGHEADVGPRDELTTPSGAYIMGRNMFGPIRGEWEGDWRGWWGDEPPYHAPVFVLTHHAHESIEMDGGTTFHSQQVSMRPLSKRRTLPATATSTSPAEPRRCGRRSGQALSTNSCSTSSLSCSVVASDCLTVPGTRSSSRSRSSTRLTQRTSATASALTDSRTFTAESG